MHIEGMGWLGSALALRLDMAGVDFTWNDIDADTVAWRASTGLVYPAGDERSMSNLSLWTAWHERGLFPAATVERSAFCFAHKKPPHDARYPMTDLGWLRVAQAPCFSVDVAGVVNHARHRFAARRVEQAPDGARRVVAHGYNDRLTSYLWGWSTPVALQIPTPVLSACGQRRPVLYGRVHKFLMAYAYPIPGRPGWWWAGSAQVPQTTPKRGNAAKAFDTWQDAVSRLYPGVKVLDSEGPRHGWRPRGAADDDMALRVYGDGSLVFPPLKGNGVRWSPELIEQAVDILTGGRRVQPGGAR